VFVVDRDIIFDFLRFSFSGCQYQCGATDCLGRLVSEMAYYVLSGTRTTTNYSLSKWVH